MKAILRLQTSCKLRVKLRVTFLKLFVEEYRKIELMGRSVARCPKPRYPRN